MPDLPNSRSLLRGLMIAAFGAALAYLFFGEHRVHLLGYLPFLFLLACPLLHMTMHGRHEGHGGHGHPPDPANPGDRTPPQQPQS
ncbi:MAG: DUF2933 domain-containing protein [Phenylobacterium sp.]|uniref:DUF2933 domain-containing protein n=1 Tax=Phenylobacterium sp. TaxID=1871053 RepID=UPI00271A74C8|nr:DUF2933 domain-containing protein [Phenylobacterium sp.]MDO8912587.1 DUF2933 domain-containing protein [Phenylobacterium sp.]